MHGGVRYLEKAVFNLDAGQLKLVFEALHERKRMLQNAPHLCHPLPIMTVRTFSRSLEVNCYGSSKSLCAKAYQQHLGLSAGVPAVLKVQLLMRNSCDGMCDCWWHCHPPPGFTRL